MENILKSISDIVTDIENEKEKANTMSDVFWENFFKNKKDGK